MSRGFEERGNAVAGVSEAIQVVGRVFDFEMEGYTFRLDFTSESSLTYTVLRAPNPFQVDTKQTVDYHRVEIRPNVYFVYWQEPDKTTVTHYEDFEKNVVYSNITTPDHEFLTLHGTIKPI